MTEGGIAVCGGEGDRFWDAEEGTSADRDGGGG